MPLKIALVLYPKMSPFHFSVPYMIFTDAMPEKGLFELKLVAEDNKLPTDVMHLKADGDLSLIEQATIVIIPGWHDYTQPPSAELIQALQKAYQRGAYLVGLCFGTYALAYTGLLDNKKAATHWFGEQDFS
ncbi:MAG TPA: AraC family transcriptional regulator, partial [Pasteurellaceae bacterium]|nr:AraC family transcriptional regulator [Pasteurellaceae bacterium]